MDGAIESLHEKARPRKKPADWQNEDTVLRFADYAARVGEALQGRVTRWFTFNEPQCFINMGCGTGEHAPGVCWSDGELELCWNNFRRAHNLAFDLLHKLDPSSQVGLASTGLVYYPVSDRPEDIEAARQLTFSLPQGVRTFSHALALDEMDKLDFVGLNHYHGIPARMGPQGPEPVPFPVGGPSTAIGWPITPEALGWGPASCISAIRNPSISARTACPAGTRSFWTARSTIPSASTSSPGIFGPWTGHCRRDRRAGILSLVPYRQF